MKTLSVLLTLCERNPMVPGDSTETSCVICDLEYHDTQRNVTVSTGFIVFVFGNSPSNEFLSTPCTYYSPISALFCPSVMGMHSFLISSVIRIRFEMCINLLCTYNTSKNCSIAWQWQYLSNMNVIQRIEQVCLQNQTSTAEKLVDWSSLTPHTRTGLYFHEQWQHETPYTDGLGPGWSNWIADVLELPHSCTEPSICNQSDVKSQQTPPQ